MKKIIYLLILILIFILSLSNITLATQNLEIKISNSEIIKDNNFKIYINIGNIQVASYKLNINYMRHINNDRNNLH